jgi:hypothetical protein
MTLWPWKFPLVALSVVDMAWSNEQRAFAVETYFSQNKSIVAVQRALRTRYRIPPRNPVPDRKSILLWVENFRACGSVVKKRVGARRTVRTPENIDRVRRSILQSPKRSARKHASALALSNRTVRRILHAELHFHPYKMVIVQELTQRDWQQRVQACETFIADLPHDAVVLFSDEAHFHISGVVNKQNMRYWSGANPRVVHERPLHSDKVTVWCAISSEGIIGPYFFEEDNRCVTINSERYVNMLQQFLAPQLQQNNFGVVWFQQDGATAHTARHSMAVLREMFPGRLISRYGDIPWPARSPDLTPCDYFLWGYLKSEVFKHRPRTLQDLKDAIRLEVARIPQQMLRRVIQNFRSRLEQCVDNEGHHLNDVLFKTK